MRSRPTKATLSHAACSQSDIVGSSSRIGLCGCGHSTSLTSPSFSSANLRHRGRKSLRLRGSGSFFARVLKSGRAYADRLAAHPDLSRRGAACRASTVVEDHVRWLDVAIEGL